MVSNHNKSPSTKEVDATTTKLDGRVASALQAAHERFGIDLNVPEIVRRTIEENCFTALEFEKPYTLPTLEEWIAQRMTQGYPGYNYGSFVIDEAEQIGFAKVRYGTKNLQTLISLPSSTVTLGLIILSRDTMTAT